MRLLIAAIAGCVLGGTLGACAVALFVAGRDAR